MRNSKFGWNLPPGAANDPNAPYNQPDHSHDHEWCDGDDENPIFEDSAALFYQECLYEEGRYKNGWQCEESRWLRCEVDRIIKKRGDDPNVTYLFSGFDTAEYDHFFNLFENKLIEVESATDRSILDLDPPNDYDNGFVRVDLGEYEVIYKQSENAA